MSDTPAPGSPAWENEAVALHVAACAPAPAAPAPVAPEVIPHQPEHEPQAKPLPVAATPTPAIPAAGGDLTTEDSTAGLSEQAGDDHVGM